MHLHQPIPRDGGHRAIGRLSGLEVIGTVDEPLPLSRKDRGGVVIALLERLKHAGSRRLQPVVIECRLAEHAEKQLQALVEVALQAVHRGGGKGVVGRHAHLGREEVERFVEFGGLHRGQAPLTHHPRRHCGKAGHADGIERRSSPECDREIHERKLSRRGQEDDRSIREHTAKRAGDRRLKCQRRKFNPFGPRRNPGGRLLRRHGHRSGRLRLRLRSRNIRNHCRSSRLRYGVSRGLRLAFHLGLRHCRRGRPTAIRCHTRPAPRRDEHQRNHSDRQKNRDPSHAHGVSACSCFVAAVTRR